MTKINLTDLTIRKAHEAMKTGDFSARELTQTYLNKITEVNPNLNAYLHLFDGALKQADEADKRFKDGTAELLTGIPMAIKNNICIKGEITTAASKILENYRAIYDATVIEKLRKAGAVFLGGTNMDEFAMGGSTENSAYGVTKNPYDDTRVSGGSSGGSVVAVAMDGSLASLGTDTGGLDQIGPVTKNVADAEIIFDCIKGDDDMDSTTIPENLIKELKVKEKMTIGIPRHFMKEGIDEDVMKNFDESIEKLKSLGHVIKDIEIPNIDYALATYYIIMPAEVSTNLSRFDGVRFGLYKDGGENLLQDYMKTRAEGFGPEARRRIILGTYVLSAALREVMKKDFTKAFEEVDIILTPTAPTPAFKIGEKSDDPVQMYLSDIFTVSANMVGVPALAVPSGFTERDSKQLPLGIQFMAPWMGENILFEIGKDFLGEK